MPTGCPSLSTSLCSGLVKTGVKQLPDIRCPTNYYASEADADIVLGRKLVDAYFIQAGPVLPRAEKCELPILAPVPAACEGAWTSCIT